MPGQRARRVRETVRENPPTATLAGRPGPISHLPLLEANPRLDPAQAACRPGSRPLDLAARHCPHSATPRPPPDRGPAPSLGETRPARPAHTRPRPARVSEPSARSSPNRLAHPNPPDLARGAHPASPTAGPRPATTSARPSNAAAPSQRYNNPDNEEEVRRVNIPAQPSRFRARPRRRACEVAISRPVRRGRTSFPCRMSLSRARCSSRSPHRPCRRAAAVPAWLPSAGRRRAGTLGR